MDSRIESIAEDTAHRFRVRIREEAAEGANRVYTAVKDAVRDAVPEPVWAGGALDYDALEAEIRRRVQQGQPFFHREDVEHLLFIIEQQHTEGGTG